MNLKNLFSFFFLVLFLSCETKDPAIDQDNLLLGSWIEPVYNEDITTFKRGVALPQKSYGISFLEKGELIERSSGFCGTPPLVFSDYPGSFERDETLIKINQESYPKFYQWRILSLTEKELVVKRELSEQEIDHRNLMTLFGEIENMVYAEPCSNSENWTFTSYGAKACGGPQGYIAYSKNIDTVTFLAKLDAYTQLEKEFNIKWNIISDCSFVTAPTSVGCSNGYPILNY